jgi:glycosyltransferase involved in cell wall biosynthesis
MINMTANNQKIKILNIITLFSVGGATETVVSMAAGLREKGYEVHIATGPNVPSEGSMYETAERHNIPVFTFPNLKRAINPLNDLLIVFQLARFIKKNNYTVVHTHSSKAGVVGRIAAWLVNTPVIVHTIHGLPFHRFQNFIVRNFYKLIEKFSALFCDKIVAVTHTIVDVMLKNNLAPEKKFVVVRSAFNLEMYNHTLYDCNKIRSKYRISPSDFLIAKVARFSKLKGHEYLIDAFNIVSNKSNNCKLLLIGNGELEGELKSYIKSVGLKEKVIFSGLIPPEDIPEILSSVDLLVHTSLLEGLARVLPQAVMLEKPVISFDLDGSHEVIKDGYNGFLIEPENVTSLAEKILMLSSDREKAKNMGINGKKMIGREFSNDLMVEKIDKFYKVLFLEKGLYV